MASPLFLEWADFHLECPCVARQLVELPICVSYRLGAHEPRGVEILHCVVALAFTDSIAHPCRIDAGVDDEMRDVDILWSKFARRTLCDSAQAEFCRGERSVADAAAQTGGRTGEENASAPARDHQACGFAPCDKSRVTGHLPDLAEHAVGGLDQLEIDVGADIENADLEGRALVGALKERGEVIFFARVERARGDSAAGGFDVLDQRRELVALTPSGESVKALAGELLRDCAPDVIAGADNCGGGISRFQASILLACGSGATSEL